MRILLVEDDPMIGQVLAEQLTEAAYAVDWVRDGITALGSCFAEEYDAVLLDLGLPGRAGLHVLPTLRRESTVPVLVITARGRLDDRVAGLDLGADDYLVKPFELDELLARLRAVLRRGSDQAEAVLRAGDLLLDPQAHTVTVGGAAPVPLTRRELAVLRALMARPGVVCSRDDLERQVYSREEAVDSNAVEFTLHKLRGKLGPGVITNVRGIGWFVPRR